MSIIMRKSCLINFYQYYFAICYIDIHTLSFKTAIEKEKMYLLNKICIEVNINTSRLLSVNFNNHKFDQIFLLTICSTSCKLITK